MPCFPILKGESTVQGFYEEYPGIYVPEGKTVTIKGDGKLTASSNGVGAGIGGGAGIASGNGSGAGISCGNISIEGGTINVPLGRICNPTALNISIYNAIFFGL